jgi:hypothetical protein
MPGVAPTEVRRHTAAALEALARTGLLLKQDKQLPSVIGLIAGAPLPGSWWSHPRGRLMFQVLATIADHPDVLLTKLLFAKDTLVHRVLWPALLAVAEAAEPWQTQRLSPQARALLKRARSAKTPLGAAGPPVRELQSRLLLHAAEVHTPSGRHQIVLSPWASWAARVGAAPLPSAAEGRRRLATACAALGAPLTALPWPQA